MPKGILYVESRPNSPEDAEAYHTWYERTHLREIVSVDGFVSARRFASLSEDDVFVAIYEIEADDIAAVQGKLFEATKAGKLSEPVGVSADPPPTVRFLRQIAAVTP